MRRRGVERQLNRGRLVRIQTEEVRRTGIGELLEERMTDFDPSLAQRRYRVFKEQTWDALQELKEIFHYHFITAQGTIAEVEENILQGAGIPEHPRTRPPNRRPSPHHSGKERDHRPRPAGNGEAA